MAKIVKDSGRYYVVVDGTLTDVTAEIEFEIKQRLELEQKLAEYNREIEGSVKIQLVETKQKLSSAKKHLILLVDAAQKVFEQWSTTGNPHGAMISLRPYLALSKKWLEDN